jgi:ABC-2 type transport system permease protein
MWQMHKVGLTKHLLFYEFINTAANIFVIIFGVIFPIFMAILFANVIAGQVPDFVQTDVRTMIFLQMTMVIPMATMFIGYAGTFSQEVENKINLRLDLFGIKKRSVLAAKILANLIFLLVSAAVYFAVVIPLVEIHIPTVQAALFLILVVVLVGIILLVMAHAIANMAGKFNRTFGITMFLYFGFMVLCGMMGLQVSQFPPFIQRIARLLPMTYMGTDSDFLLIWKGESYNPTNFIFSFVFLAIIAAVLLLVSNWRSRRRK